MNIYIYIYTLAYIYIYIYIYFACVWFSCCAYRTAWCQAAMDKKEPSSAKRLPAELRHHGLPPPYQPSKGGSD